jgi:HEPN domain-containing protein
MATTPKRVDYLASARRHNTDAGTLLAAGARPNAGHLFGLSVECAVKALLVRLGAETSADGTVQRFKHHVPKLITDMTVLPDGRPMGVLHAAAPHLSKLHDWMIDHRYWRAKDIPLSSLNHWQAAAKEVLLHLEANS